MKPRSKFTISYRVLDDRGKTVEVIEEEGYNKNYIRWSVERKVNKKYEKEMRLHQFKIVEEKV